MFVCERLYVQACELFRDLKGMLDPLKLELQVFVNSVPMVEQ